MLSDEKRIRLWDEHVAATSPTSQKNRDGLSDMGTPVRRINYLDTFRLAMGENVTTSTSVDDCAEKRRISGDVYRMGADGGDNLEGLDLFSLAEANIKSDDILPHLQSQSQSVPIADMFSDRVVSMKEDQVEALRGTNRTLAEALSDERAARLSLEERVSTLALDKDESNARFDVEMESLRLEIVQKDALIRQLSREQNLQGIFEVVEIEAQRLQKENTHLRKRNAKLEEYRLSGVRDDTRASSKSVNDSSESITALSSVVSKKGKTKGKGKKEKEESDSDTWERMRVINGDTPYLSRTEVTQLKHELRRVYKDKNVLQSELIELRRRERHFNMANKLCEDAHCRLTVVFQEGVKLKEKLSAAEVQRDDAHEALEALKNDTHELRTSNTRLRKEVQSLNAEINMLRKAQGKRSAAVRRAEVIKGDRAKKNVNVDTTARVNVYGSSDKSTSGFVEQAEDERGYFSLSLCPPNMSESVAGVGAYEPPVSTVDAKESIPLHPPRISSSRTPPLPSQVQLPGVTLMVNDAASTTVPNQTQKENEYSIDNFNGKKQNHSFKTSALTKSLAMLTQALQTSAPNLLPLLREVEHHSLDGKAKEIEKKSRALGERVGPNGSHPQKAYRSLY